MTIGLALLTMVGRDGGVMLCRGFAGQATFHEDDALHDTINNQTDFPWANLDIPGIISEIFMFRIQRAGVTTYIPKVSRRTNNRKNRGRDK